MRTKPDDHLLTFGLPGVPKTVTGLRPMGGSGKQTVSAAMGERWRPRPPTPILDAFTILPHGWPEKREP